MLTPTQIIYRAWMATDKPLPYLTSVESREISLLDPVEHKDYTENASGSCYLCGGELSGGISKKKLLPSTFTDHNGAKAPGSDYCCTGCSFCILTNPDRRQALRWFTFSASQEGLRILNRPDLRDVLVNPPEPPFVLAAPVSQKKHIALRAQVSYSRDRYLCNLEDETIEVNRREIATLLDFVEALLAIGYSKGDLSQMQLTRRAGIGPMAVEEIFERLEDYKKKRTYELAIFAAQPKTEEEAICYLDLILTTKNWRTGRKSSMPYTGAETGTEDPVESTCGHRSNDSSDPAQREQLTLENLLTASNAK